MDISRLIHKDLFKNVVFQGKFFQKKLFLALQTSFLGKEGARFAFKTCRKFLKLNAVVQIKKQLEKKECNFFRYSWLRFKFFFRAGYLETFVFLLKTALLGKVSRVFQKRFN
ncbi:hypothetical protein [Undibacterium sp.]|uniref:hypothetical protein n=1 Tax=Undibacterium sp. TaxID=1914977 RepID=UPI00273058A5|nr:hypothetical protein [Undibacterium sp.]MDP1978603.1 hypothetical protein [Undibacterium sp.]